PAGALIDQPGTPGECSVAGRCAISEFSAGPTRRSAPSAPGSQTRNHAATELEAPAGRRMTSAARLWRSTRCGRKKGGTRRPALGVVSRAGSHQAGFLEVALGAVVQWRGQADA